MVLVAGSNVSCPGLNAAPATVFRHVVALMACSPTVSTSGSSRQRPLTASAVQRWRKGLPVAGLMAVPLKTRPPCGVFSPEANCVVVCWAMAARLPAINITATDTKASVSLKSRAARISVSCRQEFPIAIVLLVSVLLPAEPGLQIKLRRWKECSTFLTIAWDALQEVAEQLLFV